MKNLKLAVRLGKILENLFEEELIQSFSESRKGELKVLMFLHQNSETIVYPMDISKKLGFTRPRISSILAGLNRKNLISTKTDMNDKRMSNVEITDLGKQEIETLKKNYVTFVSELIDRMGEKNTSNLIKYLEIMVKSIGEIS